MAVLKALVIAGGGGGSTANSHGFTGPSGGAGGVIYNASFTITAGTYSVTVGNGGTYSTSGQNSVFSSLTAIGGGGGQNGDGTGIDGGSGGGGQGGNPGVRGGYGTVGQGYDGGAGRRTTHGSFSGTDGGGGGGAGGVPASDSRNGGIGIVNPMEDSTLGQNISGVLWIAGGGYNSNYGVSANGWSGTGAGGSSGGTATVGYNGAVVISYVTANFGYCTYSGTYNRIISGANTILEMTTSGTLTVVLPPIVTTQDVTSIAATTAVGNGNITDIGSENAYEMGVAYIPASSGDITFVPIPNPSFSNATLQWTTGLGTITASTDQAKYGTQSGKLVWTSGTEAYFEYSLDTTAYRDKYITIGAWVWSSQAGKGHVNIIDYNGSSYAEFSSTPHTGNSTWQYLTVTMLCSSDMTKLYIRGRMTSSSSCTVYFDGFTASSSSVAPINLTDGGNFSTGAFTKNITGLTRTTNYRVVAFATNQYGTQYGSTVGFKTIAVAPTVTTDGVNSISQSSFVGKGNLTDDGGETGEMGFVWGTSLNPTITNNKVIVTGGIGAYSTLVAGLIANTAYHVRAYATNSIGTVYGADIAFSSLASGPMVKRRVSFLSKAQSLTIQLSNNAVDETFTVLQFAVAGEKEDKKTYTPGSIISIN